LRIFLYFEHHLPQLTWQQFQHSWPIGSYRSPLESQHAKVKTNNVSL
jgi:hypothetical protein